jgi:glycolate oxidase iron-sulfur subunit
MQILAHKMESVNSTGAAIIATANPGCLLQLQAGVRLHGSGQRVMHVVEILDEAYRSRKLTSMVAATVTGLPSL